MFVDTIAIICIVGRNSCLAIVTQSPERLQAQAYIYTSASIASLAAQHLSVASTSLAVQPADFVTQATLAAIAAGSGLMPDADHENARFSRSLKPVTTVIASALSGVFGHRGVVHSLLGCAVFTALMYAVGLNMLVTAGSRASY